MTVDVDRVLDWTPPGPRPRQAAFPLEPAIATDIAWTYRYWRPAPIMDQGSEGACVGHGVVGAVQAQPIDADLRDAQTAAFGVYRLAQFYDVWQGENYSGTSVDAGLTVARMLGLIGEFRWPQTIGEMADGIATIGPGVIGVNWTEGMFYPDDRGFVQDVGAVAGGHCVYVCGVNRVSRKFKIAQSWGVGHGLDGFVWMTWDTMERRLSDQGECAILLAQPLA